MSKSYTVFLLAIAVACSACANAPISASFPDAVVLKNAQLPANFKPVPTYDDIMRVTPAMRAFVNAMVPQRANERRRINALNEAILRPGQLGMRYVDHRTQSAEKTFATQEGNCLSLSILFVALARELGIHARFQEVRAPYNWQMHSNIVLSQRHVNVAGKINHRRDTYVLDFYPYPTPTKSELKIIPDSDAIAQFYNNIGSEYLIASEYEAARLYFWNAANLAPHLSYLWSNLGTVYSRNGQPRAAERYLRFALKMDRQNTAALGNLALLLEADGRSDEAQHLRKRAYRVQRRNPYYHLVLTRKSLTENRFADALEHLRIALSLNPQQAEFFIRAARYAVDIPNSEEFMLKLVAAKAAAGFEAIDFSETVSPKTL